MSLLHLLAARVSTPVVSGTQTFTGTVDDYQEFVVPTGVTEIAVRMWGAGGFGARVSYQWPDTAGNGGGGGAVQFKTAVTPGETLLVGAGRSAHTGASGVRNFPAGGLGDYASANVYGGGGGGRSELKRGATILAIAGGGGAGGCYNSTSDVPDRDGLPGGDTTTATANRGGSGTQSAGGAKATSASYSVQQTDGSYLAGGDGGYRTSVDGGIGGGGGDGYYGGGGGRGYRDSSTGGGGGGSNYIDTSICYDETSYAGSGQTPGNASDPDRGTAGNGGTGSNLSTGHYGGLGLVIIDWGENIGW